jgi:hypothetical protein
MALAVSRYLAVLFGVVLAVAEAVINESRPHWQYAPMWVIDYVMAGWLVAAGVAARREKYVPLLMAGWMLTVGVFYIVFFLNLDPELPEAARTHGPVFYAVGLGLGASVVGFALAAVGYYRPAAGPTAAAGS